MHRQAATPAARALPSPHVHRHRPGVLCPDRLEPPGPRQLLLPKLPAHRPRAEGVARLSRVPDSGVHKPHGLRDLLEDTEAQTAASAESRARRLRPPLSAISLGQKHMR